MPYPIEHTMFFMLCISVVMIFTLLRAFLVKRFARNNYISILLLLFVVGTCALLPDILAVYRTLTGDPVEYFSVGSASTNSPSVYVATDGSGDYNCDGIADQVEINEALRYAGNNNFDSVYLRSGTYTIDDSIEVPDNMTLTGDPDAIVQLIADWQVTRDDMFTAMITGTHAVVDNFKQGSNITISGFRIEGNKYDQDVITAMKEIDSFPAIQFYYSENITVKDMVIRDIPGDGIRLNNGESKHKVLNNTIHDTGHDDIYIKNGNYDVIDGNTLSHVAHDCGIRIDDSANIDITNNVIWTDDDGLSGIYLLNREGDSYNITIAYNEIYNTREMGIVLTTYADDMPVTSARDIHIHHNTIHGSGIDYRIGHPYGGGVWLDGWNNTVIENNIIVSSMGDGIAYAQRFPGHNDTATYNTIVRNNIIINTVDSPIQRGDGYGINNRLGENYNFALENNIVWNNENGNHNNVGSPDNDVNRHPIFADPLRYIDYKKSLWLWRLTGSSE